MESREGPYAGCSDREHCEFVAARLGPKVAYAIEILCQRWLERPAALPKDELTTLGLRLRDAARIYQNQLRAMQKSRVSHEINIRSLRSVAKRNTSSLTRGQLRTLRAELREAVEFYQCSHAQPLPTPTYRRKRLNAVKTAASRFLANPGSGVWAKRLTASIRSVMKEDRSAETLLLKCLASGTMKRSGRLAALVSELEAVSALKKEPRGAATRSENFAANWLPSINVLAGLNVDEMAPTGARWTDPALHYLVLSLVPIWIHVTGDGAFSTSDDQHHFGKWVRQIVKRAGCYPPPEWAVWTVLEKLKNKVLRNPA